MAEHLNIEAGPSRYGPHRARRPRCISSKPFRRPAPKFDVGIQHTQRVDLGIVGQPESGRARRCTPPARTQTKRKRLTNLGSYSPPVPFAEWRVRVQSGFIPEGARPNSVVDLAAFRPTIMLGNHKFRPLNPQPCWWALAANSPRCSGHGKAQAGGRACPCTTLQLPPPPLPPLHPLQPQNHSATLRLCWVGM